ncbi:MAG: hypothetical protein HRU21_13110, partial [Pseudomonadales bacterium]|nr:hypothetical protein [Pseudomonadales bacterium]
MIQELSGSQNLRLFQPQFTESLDGVAFYPPFNVISEDNQFILSMSAEQAVDQLIINGEVKTLTNGKAWQESVPLDYGDNVFNYRIEQNGQFIEKEVTVRYNGVLGHIQEDP